MDGFYQTKEEFLLNSGKGGNFRRNPLDVNHDGQKMTRYYYDYNNSTDMDLVNGLNLSAKWFDYLDWIGILVSTGNGIYYNVNRVK